jgi:hypothetical protein
MCDLIIIAFIVVTVVIIIVTTTIIIIISFDMCRPWYNMTYFQLQMLLLV